MEKGCCRVFKKVIFKKCVRSCLYVMVLVFYKIVRRLHFHTASAIGGVFGGVIFYLPLPARTMAINNLRKVFPDKSDLEIRKIARASFRNQGRNLFELLTFERLDRSFIERTVTLAGRENLENAFQKQKGTLYLCAHFGNWELMGAALSLWGYPINVIARKIYIEPINDLLLRLRNKTGMRIILRSDQGASKNILQSLKKNEIIGFLIDQDAHVPGVWVDFFGIPAYTPSGLAAIALKSASSVVSGFIIRENGKHRLEVRGPYELIRTGDKQKDIHENTQMFTRIIEGYIRQYPEQWVWMHDRWKH